MTKTGEPSSEFYVSDLLTDQNYGEWIGDMSNALLAKNKMGFVDGKLPKPTSEEEQLSEWIRCDVMVKGWLKTAMDKEVHGSVHFARTAREILVDLEERFGKGSAPRMYELRSIVALLRQEKLSISGLYTKL
ncbi:hypothetical protein LINPERHAP1_LOCUS34403 [Linum perenne]